MKPCTTIVFSLVIATLSVTRAFSWTLDVTIAGLASVPNAESHLTYVLEGGRDSNGAWQPAISVQLALKQANRRNSQFRYRENSLTWPQNGKRGFVYGKLVEPGTDKVLRLIPLTLFHQSNLDDRQRLRLTLRARLPGGAAFRESAPLTGPDRDLFNDDDLGLVLSKLRVLIDEGYVASPVEWKRIFGIFNANFDYLESGQPHNVEKLLRFIDEYYQRSVSDAGRSGDYGAFYLDFLTKIHIKDFGGGKGGEGLTLEQYALKKKRDIFKSDLARVLGKITIILANLDSLRMDELCMAISTSAMQALVTNTAFMNGVEDRSAAEKRIKRVLKSAVDCAQRFYVTWTNDTDASRGNLSGGVDFLRKATPASIIHLQSFEELFRAMEQRRLFPRPERHGDWLQVYQYFDLISN